MNIFQQIKAMVWQNNACAVCNKQPTAALLCADCQALLDGLVSCERCGFFFPVGTDHRCTRHHLADAHITCFPYAADIKTQLFQLKYHNKPQVAARFGSLLAHRWRTFAADHAPAEAIVTVPLHPKRMAERGYNQSTLLAKALTKELHLPIYSHAIERIANTRPLHSLSAAERRASLQNAFVPGADIDKIAGKRVILLDDIITTGSTIDCCAQILKNGGARSIYALAVTGHLVK